MPVPTWYGHARQATSGLYTKGHTMQNDPRAIAKAVAAAQAKSARRRIQDMAHAKVHATNLIDVFRDAILEVAALDDANVEFLLHVDDNVEPDNVFSTPPLKLVVG